MGAYCSHTNFVIHNIDPESYKDSLNVWMVKVADATCSDCGEKLRVIKKTCIDHGITQPWELTNSHICNHEHIKIKNKNKDTSNNTLTGRAECIMCLISIPVYAEYIEKNINGSNIDVQTTKWDTDKKKFTIELKNKKK